MAAEMSAQEVRTPVRQWWVEVSAVKGQLSTTSRQVFLWKPTFTERYEMRAMATGEFRRKYQEWPDGHTEKMGGPE